MTVFQWFHTLFILSMCYLASWLVTAVAMAIYYRKGSWMKRSSVILER